MDNNLGFFVKSENFGHGEFTVSITTGNDAMMTSEDLANVLIGVAQCLHAGKVSGNIRDLNGNTVGHFNYMIDGEFEGGEEPDGQ